MTSKDANEFDDFVFRKLKETKNTSRAGGPNDVKPSDRYLLFEQPFSSPLNG